jgi:hypothetical protein
MVSITGTHTLCRLSYPCAPPPPSRPLSQIKNASHSDSDLSELLDSFRRTAQLALLFVRNVARVEVYVLDDAGEPTLVSAAGAPAPTPALAHSGKESAAAAGAGAAVGGPSGESGSHEGAEATGAVAVVPPRRSVDPDVPTLVYRCAARDDPCSVLHCRILRELIFSVLLPVLHHTMWLFVLGVFLVAGGGGGSTELLQDGPAGFSTGGRWQSLIEFIAGKDARAPTPKDAFYAKLATTAQTELPRETVVMTVRATDMDTTTGAATVGACVCVPGLGAPAVAGGPRCGGAQRCAWS